MIGDGSGSDDSPSQSGEVVQRAISAIAGADGADAVAAATARALARLVGAPADCCIADADGDILAVAASDGGDPERRRALDGVSDPETDERSWPADPAVVSIDDAGSVAVWTDGGSPTPAWAARSIAGAAIDAARGRTRRAEDERRIADLEAEADQLDNFATIVAHDLRNPLAIAQGQLELARDLDDEDEHFEKVAEAHDRIQRIIDHTLTMATEDGEAVQTERVEIATVAHDAWGTVETGGATLTVSDSCRLTADRERLQQLFENLFRNSVEHGAPVEQTNRAGETGSVVAEGLTVEVGTLSDGDGFFVADNGPGIPEDQREAVFDQGYSDDGGTGFGLSIIDDIVSEHGWSVGLTEGGAGGARFEFTDCS